MSLNPRACGTVHKSNLCSVCFILELRMQPHGVKMLQFFTLSLMVELLYFIHCRLVPLRVALVCEATKYRSFVCQSRVGAVGNERTGTSLPLQKMAPKRFCVHFIKQLFIIIYHLFEQVKFCWTEIAITTVE